MTVVAIAAGVIFFGLLGGDADTPAVYVDTKPDPMAGTAGIERPGYIRANEDCEAHTPDSFAHGSFGFEAEVALTDLSVPTELVFFDESTAFIGLRDGLVLRWDLPTDETEVILDLSEVTATESDQGLVGLAVTPDSRWLLVNYTTEKESKIVAHPLDRAPDPTGPEEILTVRQPTVQHNGGSMFFDADDDLWVSFGDGGGQGDKYQNGQDPTTPLGAILQIDLDLDDFSVTGAEGNPYLDGAEGHPWVFANGVRNPFQLGIDPATGDVWVADVGQQCVEEITVLDPSSDAGANLGWPVFEGDRPFLGSLEEPHKEPTFSYWSEAGFCVVIGGNVYRGDLIPALKGQYIFTDYCKSEILVLDPATGEASQTGVDIQTPVDIVMDPAGEIYVVSMIGSIFKLVPGG